MDPKAATAHAPGKIILFGEHAVVYGRPAIAIPVMQVQADALVEPTPGEAAWVSAPDIGREYEVQSAALDDPIATLIRLTCRQIGVEPRGFAVRIRSTIPVARGLGSGAAVSVAAARALARAFGRELTREESSALAYEVEKLFHGTPSGIDNTVIAYEEPVFYVRGKPLDSFHNGKPLLIAIGDTGVASRTGIAVGDVRRGWEKEPARHETLFDRIGSVVESARFALQAGDLGRIGGLMDENHALLQAIDVSSPEIEACVAAARDSGALGAKLSGGGRGGNVIALIQEETREAVRAALSRAGAVRVIITRLA